MASEWQNYHPTARDIRWALEEHGREISLTRLQSILTKVAHENHFKYVDWPSMKMVVQAMVNRNELERIRHAKGYYRYKLRQPAEYI